MASTFKILSTLSTLNPQITCKFAMFVQQLHWNVVGVIGDSATDHLVFNAFSVVDLKSFSRVRVHQCIDLFLNDVSFFRRSGVHLRLQSFFLDLPFNQIPESEDLSSGSFLQNESYHYILDSELHISPSNIAHHDLFPESLLIAHHALLPILHHIRHVIIKRVGLVLVIFNLLRDVIKSVTDATMTP